MGKLDYDDDETARLSRRHIMRKLLVIGCCAAGKTTLSLELGRRLGLPVYHLDQLWWQPGWQENSTDRFDAALDQILKLEYWVIDGNYQRTMPLRLSCADTVILLDYSRWRCLWQVLKRWRQFRGRTRPDVTPGCPEHLNWEFLCYVWNFNRVIRPHIEDALECDGQHCRIIRLDSPAATRKFLAGLVPGPTPGETMQNVNAPLLPH